MIFRPHFWIPRTTCSLDLTKGPLTSSILTTPSHGRTSAVAGYSAVGVHFDGTNDELARGAQLTGAADGKSGIISFWFKLASTSGTRFICESVSNRFDVRILNTDIFVVIAENAAGTRILDLRTLSTTADTTTWHHLIAAWDLANTTGWLYLDDADDNWASPVTTNDSIDYTVSNTRIGRATGGGSLWNGDLADLYINYAETLDLSVTSNRRKFIDASSKPVDLGSDGSTPTGTAPIMYFSGATSAWHTNKGGGGGFTETGALTDASSSPSD